MDPKEVTSLWEERFSTPKGVFENCSFFRRSRMIWAYTGKEIPPGFIETMGVRIMSLRDRPWKPTTYALQIWGRHASKNAIHLNTEDAWRFVSGETIELLDRYEELRSLTSGYVVVLHEDEVIGCALYSQGRLICQLPKERRISCDETSDETEVHGIEGCGADDVCSETGDLD
jgi:NOL1/NOP2/fmu family ribosome biogenesis protein